MKYGAPIKNNFWTIFILLLIAGCLVYAPAFFVGFLSDDWHALLVARDNEDWWRFFTTNIVGTREGSSYGPLWNALMYTEYSLFHLHTAWYHVVSIFLLSGAGFAIYLFVSRVLSRQTVGLVAALFFVALPSHVEAVAWISGQPHLLATVLYILSLYLYLVFVQTEKKLWYGAAVFLLLASLFAKEIGITGVVGFALIDVFFTSRPRAQLRYLGRLALRLAIPTVFVFLYILLRRFATGVLAGYYGAATVSLDPYHFIRMFLEITVNIVVSFPERMFFMQAASRHVPLALCLFIIVAAVFGYITRYKKLFFWALCMYVVSVLPYLPLMYSPRSDEGERYTYLPSLFAVLIAAIVLDEIFSRFRFAKPLFGACVCIILLAAGLTVQNKLQSWRMASTLAESALSVVDAHTAQHVVAVGLPDTMNGAQMVRNGFGEALTLLGRPLRSVERVPVFVVLNSDIVQTGAVDIQIEESSWVWTSKYDRIFTGPSSHITPIGVWTLRDWRVSDQTGTAIVFTPHKEAMLTGTVFLYWNNGGLVEVPWR